MNLERIPSIRLSLIALASVLIVFGLINREALNRQAQIWSPDGEWIIFSCTPSEYDRGEIYRMRPEGGEVQQITHNNLYDRLPVSSPDGQWIALVSELREITFVWEDSDPEIYRMRPDGSGLQQLTNNRGFEDEPAWSQDGRWIVFSSNRSPHLGEWEIYRMRSDGSDVQRLTTSMQAHTPVWSPDGQWIAFSSGSAAIYRMRPDGSEKQRLTTKETYIYSTTWSPNGEWIVFVSEDGSAVYRIRADGRQEERLAVNHRIWDLTWSPDGEWIAFSTSDENRQGSIFRMLADGSHLESLLETTRDFVSLAWPPDGEWIAFSSSRFDANIPYPPIQIYKMRTDGSDLQQLTDMPCHTGSPSWLPNRLAGS